jgi:hypothetical protein
LAVDPTASPAPDAALTDASFAFSTVPLLLEELGELDRFRAVDPALLWALLLFCERLDLDRDLVVRVFADELRGFDPPFPEFRVLLRLVCWATGPSLRAVELGYPGLEPIIGICGALVGDVRTPDSRGDIGRALAPGPLPLPLAARLNAVSAALPRLQNPSPTRPSPR